ncbi:MAG TPA: extracellular solute-binding protein [Tepidisphaeraceae bacterium]|nr:extracellular solute-binding protein [Tepidisphaeraceae bacterium]
MTRLRRGQVPLWVVVCLAVGLVAVIAWWTLGSTSNESADGRETIVFWGHADLGEDVEILLHRFQQRHPNYGVVMSKAAARDLTGDAQRLMSAIAGGVPPDVVFFDRFAIGQWAARGALADLKPFIDAQLPDAPDRLNLDDYYDYTIAEASYGPPGSAEEAGIYGIPCTTDIRLLYVNRDSLRQAGLVDARGEPRPPKSWEELHDYANRLTLYRVPGDKRSGIVRLGFGPMTGNSWLYLYAWQAGGEFMNPQRTRVTMDSPPVVRALRYVTDMYDDLGGIGQVKGFEEVQGTAAMDPFMLGRLAMKIDTNNAMNHIADWRPDMDFMLVPAPMPQDRLDAGEKPVAWSGGYALVVPSTARQKQGAFELIKFLRSWEAVKLAQAGKQEQRNAEGRLFLPGIDVNRVFFERLVSEYVDGNPALPTPFKRGYETVRAMLPNTRIRPVTAVGQLLWAQQVRAMDAAARHSMADEARRAGVDEIELVLRTMQQPVQAELEKHLAPPPPTVVKWRPYLWAYAALVAIPFVLMFVAFRRRRVEYGYRAREVGAAMLFASPWMIGFVALVGGPILFSVVFSFTQYDVLNEARYVGIKNYADVVSDPVFYRSLLNTLFMILSVPIAMAVSLAIALLLNHAVRGIGFYRAAYYVPAIIPLVASSLMWVWAYNPNYGLINSFLIWLYDTSLMQALEHVIGAITGDTFHFTLPLWLQDKDWSKPSIVVMRVWAGGAAIIIWLAGLQSIPQELYEAATVDGASAWQRFRNVTVPMLSPYILFNLIIGLIATMQIFGEAYIMTEGGPADSTLFYAYYLFKNAFQYFRMGYASALAWILFLVVLSLTLAQLWLSKRWVHYEQG